VTGRRSNQTELRPRMFYYSSSHHQEDPAEGTRTLDLPAQ
jgi:hypothetical protein